MLHPLPFCLSGVRHCPPSAHGHRGSGCPLQHGAVSAGSAFASCACAAWASTSNVGRAGAKKVTPVGCRKIEQPVVRARRIADVHALQHFLDDPGTSRIADEVGAELALAWPAKRHVVAQDVVFVAIGIHDRGQGRWKPSRECPSSAWTCSAYGAPVHCTALQALQERCANRPGANPLTCCPPPSGMPDLPLVLLSD